MAGLRELLLEAALFSKEWRKARDENKVREAAKLKNDLELIFQDIKIKAAQQELGLAKKKSETLDRENRAKAGLLSAIGSGQGTEQAFAAYSQALMPTAQQPQPQQPRTTSQRIEQMTPGQLESDFQGQYFPEERVQGPMTQLDRSLRQESPFRVAEPSTTSAIAQVAAGPAAQPRRDIQRPQLADTAAETRRRVPTEQGRIPAEALRKPLAKTVREDLVATPAISRQQQSKTGTREEGLGLIDLDEMTKATMIKEVLELKFPIKGDIDYEIMLETAEKINDSRIIRSRDKQLQDKVDAIPEGIKSSAKQLLLLNVGLTAATPKNILTISNMLRKAGYTKDDEAKNAQAYSAVQRQIQEARTPVKTVTEADKIRDKLAKLKAEAEERDLKRQEDARIKLNAFPRQVQDVAKLVISVSEGIGTLKEDLGTQAIIAKMMMDQGWDPTQSPTSPNNDKIFKNISLAFQKAEIDDTVPDIEFENSRIQHLATIVAGKFSPTQFRQKMSELESANNLDIEYEDPKRTFLRDSIHSMVFDNLGQKAKGDMLFQDNLMDQLESVGEVYKEFLRLGGTTSLLGAYAAEWVKQKRLPLDWASVDPRLNDIMNKMNVLYWDFRNNLTGAHFSESEKQDYLSLFPNLRDTPKKFFHGLDSILNIYADKKHNLYGSVLGPKNYESVFDAPEPKTELSPQENIYSVGTDGGTKIFSLDNLPQYMRTDFRDQIKEIMGPDGTGDWESLLPARDVNKIYLNDPENTYRETIEDDSFIWSNEGKLWSDEFGGTLDIGVDSELESLNKKLLELDRKPYTRDEIQRIRRDILQTEGEKQRQLRTQSDREYMAREGVSVLSPERQISPVITSPITATFIGKSIPNLQKLGSPSLGEEQSISESELDRLNQQMMKTMNGGLGIKYRDNINFPGETKKYKAVGISRQQASDGIARWGFIVIDPVTRQQKFIYFQDKGIVGINRDQAKRLDRLLYTAGKYTQRGR
jgi:hypothetical protein